MTQQMIFNRIDIYCQCLSITRITWRRMTDINFHYLCLQLLYPIHNSDITCCCTSIVISNSYREMINALSCWSEYGIFTSSAIQTIAIP
jgi:hypothetical protein